MTLLLSLWFIAGVVSSPSQGKVAVDAKFPDGTIERVDQIDLMVTIQTAPTPNGRPDRQS